LVSSFDGSDDFIRTGDPVKRFGVFVGFGDEAIDGGLEINEGVEDTTVMRWSHIVGQFGSLAKVCSGV
jgi:hypothetical protein